jgi:hypothetical protein
VRCSSSLLRRDTVNADSHVDHLQPDNFGARATMSYMKAARLLVRSLTFSGLTYFGFYLLVTISIVFVQPTSNLVCNVRQQLSDYDPLIYQIHCASKLQYLIVQVRNIVDPVSIFVWILLSLIVFVVIVARAIFRN